MTPDTYTIQELVLPVGDGHELYIHDWGNKNAQTPIIYLHGGPGGQCKDKQKGQFDPTTQRVIFFDQRGCGKSTPYSSLERNTTQDIISDITKLADHLQIEKFILRGGSWGSALAFFYALKHPERVAAMVLDGIWTASKWENDWLDKGGFRVFFPEAWQKYLDSTPEQYRDDPSNYHFDRILGDNADAVRESGYIYESLEGAALQLDDRFTPQNIEDFDPAGVRIEVHYLTQACFMPERTIFDNAAQLTMPIYMIQGRYDMVCPPKTAYELSELLPNSHLYWTMSGHRAERESWSVIKSVLAQLTEKQ